MKSSVVMLVSTLVVLHPSAGAAPSQLRCPPGTVVAGEETPEVDEAWCEKRSPGKTIHHGPYRAWWPNGRLGTQGQYSNGQRDGQWVGWYRNGKLQGREWYLGGKLSRGEYWSESGERITQPPESASSPLSARPGK